MSLQFRIRADEIAFFESMHRKSGNFPYPWVLPAASHATCCKDNAETHPEKESGCGGFRIAELGWLEGKPTACDSLFWSEFTSVHSSSPIHPRH